MKKFFLLACILPAFALAQSKTAKPATAVNDAKQPLTAYTISGTITGLKDGAVVSMLDANSGQQIETSVASKGKFSFNGQMPVPDFRLLSVDGQPPYLTLYLDNSKVIITGKADAFDQAAVRGSKSHKEFSDFVAITKPYEQFFNGDVVPTEAQAAQAQGAISAFIEAHPAAFITALAVYRNFQVTADEALLEKEYAMLANPVQASSIGTYVAARVAENRKFPLGQPFADFSQADADGNMVSLSSLKGKYVLVDFWASWCRPCRQENPNVVNAFNRYKDKNFTVLGVSLDQQKPAWLDAVKQDGLNWTQVSDLKGWGNEVAALYDVKSIPQNFLIDPNGILVGKNLRGSALNAKLEKLIK